MAIRKSAKSNKVKPVMAIKNTKIQSDVEGLFVIASGIIARPKSTSTSFKEGDIVKALHFGGSLSGVAKPDQTFNRSGSFELWDVKVKEVVAVKRTRKPKVEIAEATTSDVVSEVVKRKRGRPKKVQVVEMS